MTNNQNNKETVAVLMLALQAKGLEFILEEFNNADTFPRRGFNILIDYEGITHVFYFRSANGGIDLNKIVHYRGQIGYVGEGAKSNYFKIGVLFRRFLGLRK